MAAVERDQLDALAWRITFKKFDELELSDRLALLHVAAIQDQTSAISSQTKAIGLVLDHLKGR